MSRNGVLASCIFTLVLSSAPWARAAEPTRYVRFQVDERVAYGILEGEQIHELSGAPFAEVRRTPKTHSLAAVQLLPPTTPSHVLALAGNYRSHLGNQEIPAKFQIPQPFHKGPSCLVGHGSDIVLPPDAKTVHYEAELVIVIGKKCSKVSVEQAPEYIFGVTAGNDVSERIWQNDADVKDVQWWRAKGSDTFGPVGPVIASGLDYSDLALQLRLNGEVKQDSRTSQLIHDIPTTVSFISQYVTLLPGDLIFTGTPGTTSAMQAGDVVEVELEGVGVLRNPVVAGQAPKQ